MAILPGRVIYIGEFIYMIKIGEGGKLLGSYIIRVMRRRERLVNSNLSTSN